MVAKDKDPNGPKYEINFEGTIYDWHKDSITEEELRTLVGANADQPMLQVNLEDNTEIPFPPGGTLEVKPGHGFSRKFGFKRG